MLGDLRHHGLASAVERRTVGGHEVARLPQPGEIAVDLRHHVARYHVPAAPGVFRVGPIVDEADDGAETAGKLEDCFDPRHEIVRSADGSSGAGSKGGLVHGLIGGGEGPRAGPLQCRGDIFVMMPQQAIASLGPGLVAGFGDMPAQQHAPVCAINGLAVLGGSGLREAPLGW